MPNDNEKDKQKQALEALQDVTRAFNLRSGPHGGRDGAEQDPLSEGMALTDRGGESKEGVPKPSPALHGVTRNMQFAEVLAGEQRELDPGARTFLKGVLGPGVDKVKVYTGKYADMAARSLGAEAFAIERHVFFRSDKFDPGSSAGLGLLAHELAHTLQGKEGSRAQKEEEARGVQSRAGELAEQGSTPGYQGMGAERELAFDQAPLTGGDVPSTSSKSATTTGEKQGSLAEQAGKSVEEAQLFDVLKVELFRRLRDEIDMGYRVHGTQTR